jgi:hypothetical protein
MTAGALPAAPEARHKRAFSLVVPLTWCSTCAILWA